MRLYDIVALVTPDLSDEDAQKVAAEYRKILSDGGAEIVKDETWGRRRLAARQRGRLEVDRARFERRPGARVVASIPGEMTGAAIGEWTLSLFTVMIQP